MGCGTSRPPSAHRSRVVPASTHHPHQGTSIPAKAQGSEIPNPSTQVATPPKKLEEPVGGEPESTSSAQKSPKVEESGGEASGEAKGKLIRVESVGSRELAAMSAEPTQKPDSEDQLPATATVDKPDEQANQAEQAKPQQEEEEPAKPGDIIIEQTPVEPLNLSEVAGDGGNMDSEQQAASSKEKEEGEGGGAADDKDKAEKLPSESSPKLSKSRDNLKAASQVASHESLKKAESGSRLSSKSRESLRSSGEKKKVEEKTAERPADKAEDEPVRDAESTEQQQSQAAEPQEQPTEPGKPPIEETATKESEKGGGESDDSPKEVTTDGEDKSKEGTEETKESSASQDGGGKPELKSEEAPKADSNKDETCPETAGQSEGGEGRKSPSQGSAKVEKAKVDHHTGQSESSIIEAVERGGGDTGDVPGVKEEGSKEGEGGEAPKAEEVTASA